MEATINVTFGDDLSMTIELRETNIADVHHTLGAICNEIMRTNFALAAQAEATPGGS